MSEFSLDQFYTQRLVARRCWGALRTRLRGLPCGDEEALFFVEPSAGDGAFYDLLPERRRVGLDIAPKHAEVKEWDFLGGCYKLRSVRENTVVVGNPPFGKRGNLAVRFFQQAFEIADTVAFIVPVIFRKYFIHKQMPSDVKWIYSKALPLDSFRTEKKSVYSVHAEFQIWTRLSTKKKDLRLWKPPPISHPDFVMHQYNNTKDALKVFKEAFDFAVPCQGYQDYKRREKRAENCEKWKQWMLFQTKCKKVLQKLLKMNYEGLSKKYTTCTPGFRKGDVVKEYGEVYG